MTSSPLDKLVRFETTHDLAVIEALTRALGALPHQG
jgi:hypothetical protein